MQPDARSPEYLQIGVGSAGDQELLDSLMREAEQLGSIAATEALIGQCSGGGHGLLVGLRVSAHSGTTCPYDFVSDRAERGRELVADHRESEVSVEPDC